MTTVFGKIIQGEIPCDKVYEDDDVLAFKDLHPAAPIHILIVPKKEIPNLQSVAEEDLHLIGKVVKAAQQIATQLKIEDYRLLTNNGTGVGQSVFHLHFHLLAGKPMTHLGV